MYHVLKFSLFFVAFILGKPSTRTWTLLDQTANAGTNSLVLQQPVDWKVGDEVVIATTGHRHTQSENEKGKISAISGDGLTLTLEVRLCHLTLNDNFNFQHF